MLSSLSCPTQQQYLLSGSNAQFFIMSSTPQVLTELERIPDSESSHQHTRKRKKKPRPSPIALEPCAG